MTLQEFLNEGDKFALTSGIQITELRSGYCRAEMTVEERHLNGGGVCQGGALFTLGDLAVAGCANAYGKLCLSISSQIHFVRSAKLGEHLKAECTEQHNGKIPLVETRITNDEGTLIALMTSECFQKDTPLPTGGFM